MSEPKLISPLLDGFVMGDPLSEHDGVCCCPALEEYSEKKYIVKVIYIPASQVQLEALLLTGAYRSSSAAMDYFKELTENVLQEAEVLRKLSKLEGFLPYEGWQVVQMDGERMGYEIYLLSPYKNSLEKFMRRNNMTHLAAVNLGLDLCSALSAARRSGWMYADLKPSNIFITENNDYRIGDLGFVSLSSMKYASLPRKYRSAYTAPELHDDLATPNETLDTYALGMILYQIYNNGILPDTEGKDDSLPAPANADYEMAEIILKACAPKPEDRWEDPAAMGHALVAYMQRNTVNNTPIVPPSIPVIADLELPGMPLFDETLPGMNQDQELTQEDLSEEMAEMITQADELICHEIPEPAAAEVSSPAETEADIPMPEEIPADSEENVSEKPEEPEETPTSGEQTPTEPASEQNPEPTAEPESDPGNYTDLDSKRRKEKWKKVLSFLSVLLLFVLLAVAGYWYYSNYYVITVNSMEVETSDNTLTVLVDTCTDETVLRVVCTDTYGNVTTAPLKDGKASFEDMQPDMLYKLRIEAEGFHQLSGTASLEFMTPAVSSIVNYTAMTGPADGSVVLNFEVEGPDSDEWTVVFSAEDEEIREQTFTGHSVTVTGLTVGKHYSFRMIPSTDLYLVGEDRLEFTATSIILAENLQLNLNGDATITVTWDAPEQGGAESWEVFCYSNDGYEKRISTTDLTASFDGIHSGAAYTVEVTAAGMTQPVREYITANPITITSTAMDESDPMCLKFSWEYEGEAPTGGWMVLYTIDGSDRQEVAQCQDPSAVIEIRIPGATYDLHIQAADGTTVFQGDFQYKAPNAEIYENPEQAFYPGLQSEYFFVNLLRTPQTETWTHSDIYSSYYTTTFNSGDQISVLFYFMQDFYIRHEDIAVMYVIRDAEGKVLTDLVGRENLDWRDDMWCGKNYHYCGLDVPAVPTDPGEYTLYIYFNGLAVTAVNFTITQ